jgi:hypothetical protein
MNKTGKIVLGIIAGITIFAVGVQYSPQVLSYVDKLKGKLSSKELKDLEDLKNKISDDLMLKNKMPDVFAIGTHEDKTGSAFIMITVKDERVKSEVEKYLLKNSIDKKPIRIIFGEMAKAK